MTTRAAAPDTTPPTYDDERHEPRRRDVERLLRRDALPMSDHLKGEARGAAERLFSGSAHAPVKAGDRVGPYRVERLLGLGGQAFVYEATHEALGRRVALKIPRAEVAERVLHEARLAAPLDHPHIVRVEDVGQEEDVPFLVMEVCQGGSLDQLLERHPGGLPLDEVREVSTAVLEALAFAHGRGIVHRDVKPANVLFDGRGTPKLADLGIGTLATGGPDLHHSVSLTAASHDAPAGTPLYVAPEQEDLRRLEGGSLDGRADLFSFGKMLFVMLTGATPRTIRPPSRLRPGLSTAWDDLVFRLLEEDRTRRPGSASEVLAALRAITEPRPAPVPVARLLPATRPSTPPAPTPPAAGPSRVEVQAKRRRRAARLLALGAWGSAAFAAGLEVVHPTIQGAAAVKFIPVKLGALVAGLLLAWFAGLERRTTIRPTSLPVAGLLVLLLGGWAPWAYAHPAVLEAAGGFAFTAWTLVGLTLMLGFAARLSLFKRSRRITVEPVDPGPPPAGVEVRVRPRGAEALPELPRERDGPSTAGRVVLALVRGVMTLGLMVGLVVVAAIAGAVLIALAALS